MLQAFRLMLVFTMLDPIRVTVADLFVAVGQPERVVKVRALQLAVMIIGLFILGPRLGIAGVALAVDAMLMAGIAVLLWQARQFVDFSAQRMFAAPTLALLAGLLAGYAIALPLAPNPSPWISGALKVAGFTLAYSATLLLLEKKVLVEVVLPAASQLPFVKRLKK
jgi:O-antigen/teichoic acid export membrane protein